MWNVSGGALVNMTVYVDTITNIFVTWKLKGLSQGDCYCCQCQGSKKIKGKIWWFLITYMVI